MSILFAAVLPVILLFCGLSLDVGLLHLRKLQMQSAADAGALGAELAWERGTGNWVAQGQADAAMNGFTNGSNNVSVAVVSPATGGAYGLNTGTIQVTVTGTVRTIFMGALNGGLTTVSALAIAQIPNCGFFMNRSLLANNYHLLNTSINTPCPVYINQGMDVAFGATATGGSFSVAGTASQSSNAGNVSPAPSYGAAVLSDPLASITAPAFSSCTYTAQTWSNTTVTLNPGTYCKGFNISSASVTLNPGLYIVTGGANWSNGTVSGNGVTLYFTQGGGGSYGQFQMSSATVNISAPTTSAAGGIPGIVVFGDRNWVKTSQQDFICTNGTVRGDGIWYTTGTGLYFSSCTISGTNYLGMVTDTLYSSGSSSTMLLSNYTSVAGGNPFRTQGVLVQ